MINSPYMPPINTYANPYINRQPVTYNYPQAQVGGIPYQNLPNMPQIVQPPVETYPQKKEFTYTQDEQKFLQDNPYGNITDYLVQNKNYKRALEYLDSVANYDYGDKNVPHYSTIEKYADNKDFDDLAQSKYFKGAEGFKNLADIVKTINKNIEIEDAKCYNPKIPIDMETCLSRLDKFFNSKYSEDLKEFVLHGTDKLSNLVFLEFNLDKIDGNPDVKQLTEVYHIL